VACSEEAVATVSRGWISLQDSLHGPKEHPREGAAVD